MNELSKPFSELFSYYKECFTYEEHSKSSRADLMNHIKTNTRGVYSYWKKGSDKPIYIGCSGKIGSDGLLAGNTIKNRIFSANTPCHFSKECDLLLYGPTTTGVLPEGYKSEVPIENIVLRLIIITNTTAPAALEHLLLQGYINEFGLLPEANQKI